MRLADSLIDWLGRDELAGLVLDLEAADVVLEEQRERAVAAAGKGESQSG